MKLFLVGKYVAEDNWEVQGIYDSEEKAVKACTDPSYFIGPFILNKAFPSKRMSWPNSYYPFSTRKLDKKE